ncbi:hypothetical protein CAF53_23745 [Sphingobium sp. LB126]|nr:hypothetical protein CAF53_23745 [Sphingobium sp. LB126]
MGNTAQASLEKIEAVATIGHVIDPAPLVEKGRNWTKWAGPLISFLILVAVSYQLRQIDYRSLFTLLPSNPLFWGTFIASYLVGPASEWIIFRRLWSLPAEGFAALLRKLVSNEILLGYLGEVYFYTWARRNAHVSAAPFGAIKDVAILSALTGNVFTLLMVIMSAPFLGALHLGIDSTAFVASALFILGSSIGALLLRKRLFTLPRRELWFVAGTHVARIIISALLAAIMWHLLLPAVALSWWLLLATARQLLSRLPFLPNKDVVFAGLAVFMVGSDQQIVAAMTLMASLILGAHLLVGGSLGMSALLDESRMR